MTAGRAARRGAADRPAGAAARDAPDAALELHHQGRRLAPRAMFRRNLATGGDLVEWVWRRPTRAPRPARRPVRHQRLDGAPVAAAAALRPGAGAAPSVRTESFVFGTRLTRVTRLLRDRDRDAALARRSPKRSATGPAARASATVFREFNQKWARRVLRTQRHRHRRLGRLGPRRSGARRRETARLQRNCHRLVWLNPLAGTAGYQPLAAGMRGGLPVSSTTSCRPGRSPASSGWASSSRRGPRAGRRWAPRRSGAARRPGRDVAGRRPQRATPGRPSGAARIVAVPRARSAASRSTRPRRGRSLTKDDCARLIDTLHEWATGAPTSAARSSSARSARRRGPRARSCSCADDGRLAGSVSGGCVEGAAFEEIERARARRPRPGHPLRHQRRAGVGRRARLRRHDRRAGRAGRARRRSRRPRTSERGTAGRRHAAPRRRAAAGVRRRTSRATGAPPAAALIVRRRTAALDGHRRDRDRGWTPSWSADAPRRLGAGPVAHGRRWATASIRGGVPGPAAARHRGRRPGRHPARRAWRASSATRRSSSTAGRRSPRRSGSRTSTGSSSAGRTRSPSEIGLGPADAVAVLSHDVKFDEPAIVEALRRGCRYVGAVGSRKTQADRRARLSRRA